MSYWDEIFMINDVVKKTTASIYKTINKRDFFISFLYTEKFYQKYSDRIDEINRIYDDLSVKYSVSIGNVRSFINVNDVDVCFVDQDFIPRLDLIIKIQQYLNINSEEGINILGANVLLVSESDKSSYVCNKPDYATLEYITRRQCIGILYVKKEIYSRLSVLKKSFNSPQELIDSMRLILPRERVYNIPIILCRTYKSDLNLKKAEHSFSVKMSEPVRAYKKSDRVVAIIPFFNNIDITLECIDSIRKSNHKNTKIIAVNNNSEKSIAELVASKVDVLINADIPFNYSSINNIAAMYAKKEFEFDYYLFLNNDVVLEHNTLEELLCGFSSDYIGAVGCKLLYPDGRIQFGGVGLSHNRQSNKHNWYHIDQPRHVDDAVQSSSNYEAHSLTAACLMVRKNAADRIAFYDADSFPIGFSDADFCLRIRDLGFDLIYTSKTFATHHESLSRGVGFPDDLEGILCECGEKEKKPLPNLTLEVIKV